MKEIVLTYFLLSFIFAFLACGAIISAFSDIYPALGPMILWTVIPFTALFMVAAIANMRWAIPQLLLKQRYAAYCMTVVGIAYATSAIALGIEYEIRTAAKVPLRINDYLSPWVWVDTLCNSMLLLLILFGIGARQLYIKWYDEMNAEKLLAERLQVYIRIVRERLNPDHILQCLDDIGRSLMTNCGKVPDKIRRLSAYLRAQLYELPQPPSSGTQTNAAPDYSRLTGFLIDRRFRVLRNTIFQIVLLTISCEVFFITPDNPDFKSRAGGVAALYLFLNILAYTDIFMLFPRFRKNRSLRRHGLEICGLIAVSIAPLIMIQLLTYDENQYDKSLPTVIKAVSTAGSLFTLFLFVGGVSAIMFYQDWISGQRRVTLLKAETTRQEYAFLKKQINPHFLFNVLNNIGILSEEDPHEATGMLSELRRLIKYQFDETACATTSLGKEIDFLDSYLSLACTRIPPLCYTLSVEPKLRDLKVPTLLFLPFVENAVKYSVAIEGKRSVEIGFSMCGEMMIFECANRFNRDCISTDKAGGLGIENTCRRLELLYSSNFKYRVRTDGNLYRTELMLPCGCGSKCLA